MTQPRTDINEIKLATIAAVLAWFITSTVTGTIQFFQGQELIEIVLGYVYFLPPAGVIFIGMWILLHLRPTIEHSGGWGAVYGRSRSNEFANILLYGGIWWVGKTVDSQGNMFDVQGPFCPKCKTKLQFTETKYWPTARWECPSPDCSYKEKTLRKDRNLQTFLVRDIVIAKEMNNALVWHTSSDE